ncbi:hypothetical protein [Sinanaerobacter sp. ZZT-01]|uniref:hypothetical protein n=1 Tax=Sinanaerobacter sp. ZZT-01 TaxID=3111540 RepID=UPI002D78F294|nr:hypothetical protein [Sinanaerobacter sp. ZZT-01]WRR92697.1 hypothetical protein U5921_11670 [Sinanaerobacter sp. ZZT-01]
MGVESRYRANLTTIKNLLMLKNQEKSRIRHLNIIKNKDFDSKTSKDLMLKSQALISKHQAVDVLTSRINFLTSRKKAFPIQKSYVRMMSQNQENEGVD